MSHRAGFVNIIGKPNVGKSTLMNAMIGENLSIITSKAQTTRHRILGIVNGEDFQVVYSDTPGLITPAYKLQEYMVKFARSAFTDADIILYVTDIEDSTENAGEMITQLNKLKIPLLILINKIDLSHKDQVNTLITDWQKAVPAATVIPISALEKFNLEKIFMLILESLPESPPFYPKDELTDKSERFFVSEIIREKILMNYQQEVPYAVEVAVENFKESGKIINIRCIIYVERESQKGILIGRQGKALKKVGSMARSDIEKFFGKQAFLELFVKVKKDWRNDGRVLKQFGYNPT
ncbi:MAG: GTPase Era [Bacteroides sp. SM23_62]|nr:MAG: GTPase Era [Bacteroides sp. SM23_62]